MSWLDRWMERAGVENRQENIPADTSLPENQNNGITDFSGNALQDKIKSFLGQWDGTFIPDEGGANFYESNLASDDAKARRELYDATKKRTGDVFGSGIVHGLLSLPGTVADVAYDLSRPGGVFSQGIDDIPYETPNGYIPENEWLANKNNTVMGNISGLSKEWAKPYERQYEDRGSNLLYSLADSLPESLAMQAVGWGAGGLVGKAAQAVTKGAKLADFAADGTKAANLISKTGNLYNGSSKAAQAARFLTPSAETVGATLAQSSVEGALERYHAIDDYVKEAKRNGNYVKGVTEQQAIDVGNKVYGGNMMVLPFTNALEYATTFGKRGLSILNNNPALKSKIPVYNLIVSSLMEGNEEAAQEIINRMANNKDWSLDDQEIVDSYLSGAIMGGGQHIAFKALADSNIVGSSDPLTSEELQNRLQAVNESIRRGAVEADNNGLPVSVAADTPEAPKNDQPSIPMGTDAVLAGVEPFLGVRMDNGANGCVEAVTKIGAEMGSPFLSEQLRNGVVYVPTLVQNAGDRVIPFDANQLEAGDIIVYGDDDHVVMYDGKGGYVGNSSSREKVVHEDDYTAMGDLEPTKIIKNDGAGGRYVAPHNMSAADAVGEMDSQSAITLMNEFLADPVSTKNITKEKLAQLTDDKGNFVNTPENRAAVFDDNEAAFRAFLNDIVNSSNVDIANKAAAELSKAGNAEMLGKVQNAIAKNDGIALEGISYVARARANQLLDKIRTGKADNKPGVEAKVEQANVNAPAQKETTVPAPEAAQVTSNEPTNINTPVEGISAPTREVGTKPRQFSNAVYKEFFQDKLASSNDVDEINRLSAMQNAQGKFHNSPANRKALDSAYGQEMAEYYDNIFAPRHADVNVRGNNQAPAPVNNALVAEANNIPTPEVNNAPVQNVTEAPEQNIVAAPAPKTSAAPVIQEGAINNEETTSTEETTGAENINTADQIQNTEPEQSEAENKVEAPAEEKPQDKSVLNEEDYHGFLNGKSALVQHNIKKQLANKINPFGDAAGLLSLKHIVERWAETDTKNESSQKGKKYFVHKNSVSKTVYEYYNYLMDSKNESQDKSAQNQPETKKATDEGSVVVTGDEFGEYKDIKDLRKKAIKYYSDNLQGKSVVNEKLGEIAFDDTVEFTGSGKKEMKGTSAKKEKLLLVKYLQNLIKYGKDITESPAQKEKHIGETFYYIHTKAMINGKEIPVIVTLIKRNNGQIQYYNHTLPSLENQKDSLVSAEPESSKEALGTPPVSESLFSDSNISQEQEKDNKKQIKNNEESIFGDIEENKASMFEALGINPDELSDEKILTAPEGIVNTAEERERLEKELMAELSKLSANPVFNPKIYSLALQIGMTYVKDGINTAKKLIAKLNATFGDKIGPWAPAIAETISTWPKGVPFDEKKVMAVSKAIGAVLEQKNGDVSLEATQNIMQTWLKNRHKEFAPMIEASYNGIKKYFELKEGGSNEQRGESESTNGRYENVESGESEENQPSGSGRISGSDGREGTRVSGSGKIENGPGLRQPGGMAARVGVEASADKGDNQRGNQSDVSLTEAEKNPSPTETPGHNYEIKDNEDVSKKKPAVRFKQNIAAIKMLKQLEADGRMPTPSEQEVLAGYNGWGGLKDAFLPDSKMNKELQEVLTDEEYEAARSTINDAFYTSPKIIRALWEGVSRLGFKGGRILEPSMGIGNFFGAMPRDIMDKASLHGVEIDDLTSRFAKMLYPNAQIQHTGFQKAKTPDNFYDLVVSNIPFGQLTIDGYQIHNYFFANGMDKVRPGGLMMYITSQGSLAGGTDAAKMRSYLAGKADLIGAFKLPSGAFGEAGTDVATDIVIFKKREKNGEKSPHAQKFLNVNEKKETTSYGYSFKQYDINEYFEEHPDNMLGTVEAGKDQYGKPVLKLKMNGTVNDVAKQLSKAMKSLPQDIYQPVSRNNKKPFNDQKTTDIKAAAAEKTRDYAYYQKGNKVYQNQGGEEIEITDEKKVSVLKDFIKLKNTLNALLNAERDPKATDKQIAAIRKTLNKDYDDFVSKNGYLNDTKAAKYFRDDPAAGFVQVLEKPIEESYTIKTKNGEQSRKRLKGVEKSDIFTKRTIQAKPEVTHVEKPDDALIASLTNKGYVDIDYMAELMKTKPEDIIGSLKGKIFKNPEDGNYVTREEYLSGNVKEKLAQAEAAAADDYSYTENVEELKKVIPQDLVSSEIDIMMGAPWVPESDVQDFADSLVGNSYGGVRVKFNRATGVWLVKGYGRSAKYKLDGISFADFMQSVLNNKPIKIYDGSGDDKVLNQQKTDAANLAADEMRQDFINWIWSDKDREKRLTDYYNDNFNTDVVREYDGSHLTFPGMNSKINMKPHQKNVVWRMLQGLNTLIAHCVGAGKTFEMQAAGMEMRRLGIANKPMYCLPNNVVEQFAREFRQLYPQAKILTLQSSDLPAVTKTVKLEKTEDGRTKEINLLEGKSQAEIDKIMDKRAARTRMLSRIRSEDWDAIIISHDLFERFPLSPETTAQFIRDEMDLLERTIIEAREDKSLDTRTLSNLEQKKQKLKDSLEESLSASVDDIGITFEDLGIDQLFVDEADLFKNLGFNTKLGNIRGLNPDSKSNRANDMFAKTQWLTRAMGGRGVVFATGTPISNTMAEMYIMLRYLNYADLEKYNLDVFDNWLRTFGDIGQDIERKPTGDGFRDVTKVKKFVNMTELKKMFMKVADIKTQDELNLNIPELKNGKPTVVTLEPDPTIVNYIKNVVPKRVAAMGKGFKKQKGDDNMLALTNDLRKLSLNDDKIEACAENIAEKYFATNDIKGAQLVFCDMGIPKADSGKDKTDKEDEEETFEIENPEVYKKLIEKLIEKGIPAKEIAFIQDYNGKKKRDAIFQKVNNGEVRVLLGSTQTMGAGTNCQEHLVALHDLDAPWRPRDLEQRHGRILRQGNKNKEVEIFNYVVKDSFDANMWEKLKNKATIIAQAVNNDMSVRTLEDVELNTISYAEIEEAATGNPLIKERLNVNNAYVKEKNANTAFKQKQYAAENVLDGHEAKINEMKSAIEKNKEDIANRKETKGDKFSMVVDGKTYNERSNAEAALNEVLGNFKSRVSTAIGQIGGFNLKAVFDGSKVCLQLVGKRAYPVNKNSIPGIEATLNGGPEKVLDIRTNQLRSFESDVEQAKEIMKLDNPHEAKVKELKARLDEIDREIKASLVGDKNTETTAQADYDVEPEETTEENLAVEAEPEEKPAYTPLGDYGAEENVEYREISDVESAIDAFAKECGLSTKRPGSAGRKVTYIFITKTGAKKFLAGVDDVIKKAKADKNAEAEKTTPEQDFLKEHVIVGTVPAAESKKESSHVEVGEFKHTKTGELIPSAKVKDKFDDWNQLKSIAKKHGGTYSRFAKRFLFDNEAGRDAFAKEIDELLSKGDNKTRYSVSEQSGVVDNRTDEEIKQDMIDSLGKNIKVKANGDTLTIYMPNDVVLDVELADNIDISDEEADQARKEHGIGKDVNITVNGTFTVTGAKRALIRLARNGKKGTAYHEIVHLAYELALTKEQKHALKIAYGDKAKAAGKNIQEYVGDKLRDDVNAGKKLPKGLVKIKNAITDMIDKLSRAILGKDESAYKIMRDIETGKIWESNSRNGEVGKKANSISEKTVDKNNQSDDNVGKENDSDLQKRLEQGNPINIDLHPVKTYKGFKDMMGRINWAVAVKYGLYDENVQDIFYTVRTNIRRLEEQLRNAKSQADIDNIRETNGYINALNQQFQEAKPIAKEGIAVKLAYARRGFECDERVVKARNMHPYREDVSLNGFEGTEGTGGKIGNEYERGKIEKYSTGKSAERVMPIVVPHEFGDSNELYKKLYDEVYAEKGHLIEADKRDEREKLQDELNHSNKSGFSNGKTSYSISPQQEAAPNNFLKRAFENFGKSDGVKAGKIIVEEDNKPQSDGEMNLKNYIFSSPSRIAQKVAAFRAFYQMGSRAMDLLTKKRSDYNRKLDKALSLVDNADDMKELNDILLTGDAEGKEWTKEELISDGVKENVAEAYVQIRKLMDKAYRMVNEARRRPQVHTINKISNQKMQELRDNDFVDILSDTTDDDGNRKVTYKEYANWERTDVIDKETLDRYQSDPAIQILDINQEGDNYTVTIREGVPPVNKLTGYIPHFFHNYMIRVMDDEGNIVATIGSGRTEKDAVEKAEQWLQNNQLEADQTIHIAPKMADFTSLGMDEGQYAAVMGDKDYYKMMNSIAEKNDMTLAEAKEMLDGSVRKKGRHRFFGNLLQRKGVKGYEEDMNYILRHYFNSASRYYAMETEFKPKAINLYERLYGDFNKDAPNKTAKYTKDYINDINGNPTKLEQAINEALMKSKFFRKFVASNFGDRAALQLASNVSSAMNYMCLGYLNASSALLNLTQLINSMVYIDDALSLGKGIGKVIPALGHYINKGFKHKWDMKDLRILNETNVLNDIGLDSGAGYDVNRMSAKNLLGKINKGGMVLFKTTEAACRCATVLAAYDAAIKRGKSHSEAIEFAKEVNRKSNFDYGISDAPNIFRRGSIVSQLALQFKKYAIKELEVMGDMLPGNNATSGKQKILFWGTYLLLCGLMGLPGLDWLDDLFGGKLKPKAQEYIMEATGDSPIGRALAQAAMYGLAAPTAGVDISSRAGLPDVIPTKGRDLTGPAISKTVGLVSDLAQGNYANALRDVSPGLYNQYAAWLRGYSTGKRNRVNNVYDSFWDKALRSIGFKSVEERMDSDIQRITSMRKKKLTERKQQAIDDYIEDPSSENLQRLKDLGIKGKQVQEERKKKKMDRLERNVYGMSKDAKKQNKNIVDFAQ